MVGTLENPIKGALRFEGQRSQTVSGERWIGILTTRGGELLPPGGRD